MTFAGELARLKELAARFDDEALVAFANVGLLRRARKLLEPDEPTLGEGAEGGLEASGDGWSVRIRRGGALTTARCDCPSAGPCQHVVAVILALRERTTATAAGPAVAALLLVGAGLALTVVGMRAASRQLGVSRYRPAPWGRPEYLTVACGLAGLAVIGFLASQYGSPQLLNPPASPFRPPELPPMALLSAAIFALPGFLTPASRMPA